MSDLGAAKDLTPERFVGMFSEFQFKLSRTVQKPESFLKSRSGDCDDFSTLAAAVLRQKGYTTRLVAVVMPREVHVVCYVMQSRGYLDYNRRKAAKPVVPCDGGLASIAASVARSFHTDWRSVSEFTFEDGSARFVETEFR